ncbi:tho complex subunit 6 [Anaeramoeba flamelloides]|uniref:Tho complex subunit 6 n=1 Tax=Anaeramoeba flamelloides TaxID=1746091 RepID=A0ABQ8XWB3_9EUKA|nr:tho complex subunit 6 [Anaeramoeba flamelloides]
MDEQYKRLKMNSYTQILASEVSHDGKYLIFGSNFGYLNIYSVSELRDLQNQTNNLNPIRKVQITKDPIYCIHSSEENIFIGHPNGVSMYNFQTLLRGKSEKPEPSLLFLYETVTKRNRKTIKCLHEANGIAYDEETKRLYAATGSPKVCVWDTQNGEVVEELDGHFKYLYEIKFVPPSKEQFITGSEDGTVGVWDKLNSKILGKFDLINCKYIENENENENKSLSTTTKTNNNNCYVNCFDIDKDGRWLVASAGDLKYFCLWQFQTRTLFAIYQTSGTTSYLKFSNGQILSIGNEGFLYKWSLDGKLLQRIRVFSDPLSLNSKMPIPALFSIVFIPTKNTTTEDFEKIESNKSSKIQTENNLDLLVSRKRKLDQIIQFVEKENQIEGSFAITGNSVEIPIFLGQESASFHLVFDNWSRK